MTKVVSTEDILKAMEENGYKVNRDGSFFRYEEEVYACAIGQAAINLFDDTSVSENVADSLYHFLNGLRWNAKEGSKLSPKGYGGAGRRLGEWIADLNDGSRKNPKTIARLVRKYIEPSQLNETVAIEDW